MDYRLRPIQEKDNTALSKVIKTALEDLNYAIEGTVYTDKATDQMSKCYQAKNSIYFIADLNGEVLGGSGIAPIPHQKENYCELQRMFLSKKARGQGIGVALMQKCIEFAKSTGYELIYIETFEHMPEARGLYEKFGFKYVEKSLGDTGHFSCDVKMILKL